MAAERRGPDDAIPTAERTRRTQTVTDESTAQHSRPVRRSCLESDPQKPPLSYRIERARLRARIAALEQALETSENRRQAVIDQYERLLSEREDAGCSSHPESSEPDSLLARLVGR